jgi:PAS domain S-box-containing protein
MFCPTRELRQDRETTLAKPPEPGHPWHYCVALLSVVVASILRMVLDPALGNYLPFGVLLLAVAFMAWWGGSGPALVTVITGYLATTYFFMPPRHSFAISGLSGWINILVYFAISGGLVWAAATRRAAQRRGQESGQIAVQLLSELQTLYDQAPIGLCFTDVNHSYVKINKQLAAVNDRPVAEHLGHTVGEIAPELAGTLQPLLQQVIASGDSINQIELHCKLPRDSRSERYWLGSSHPVKDVQGTILGVNTTMLEITERKRTEAALQFKACALAQISEAVAAFDMNGRLTYWNPAARQMYGYTEQEAMGRTAEELFQYQWLGGQNLRMAMAALIKTGFWRSENIHKRKCGAEFLVESSTSLLRDERGEITSYLSVLRDITERRRTEEAIARHGQRLELLSQTAAHLLLGDDPPAVIETIFQKLREQVQVDVYFNCLVKEDGAALWLHSFAGVSEEVAHDISHLEFGQAVCGLVAATRQPLIRNHIQQSEEPMVQLVKGYGVRAYACHPLLVDGRLLGTLSVGSRSKDEFLEEELELFQILSRYIALALDRWRLLREATHRAEELERRVAERTARLQESLSSLEGVLYHVAHDLRAPLRSMHSFTELLLEDYAPNLDATGEQYAQIISESSKKMDVLIGDLLNFGRLGHRPVCLTAVDLTALVGCVVAGLDGRQDGQKPEIRVDKPLPKVWGDPQIIEQILLNLLGNSLKFVAPNTTPRIRLWAETCDQTVRLNLQDNGIGVAPEYQERIFGVFERLHTDAYPGTGIGLAIVKKGMERLQGRVGIESRLGAGSRFWLEFRRAAYE